MRNLPRCEITDLIRPICAHCRTLGVQLTDAERAWVESKPATHHLVPQYKRRTIASYPTGQRWSGTQFGAKPADIIACQRDGHHRGDAFLCPQCVTEWRRHLEDVPQLVRDLQIAVAKDVQFPQRGARVGGVVKDEAPVNFNIAARAAVDELREALPWPDLGDKLWSKRRPVELLSWAARRALTDLPELLRQPDCADLAERLSRAVVHGRRVIDRPRDVTYYGVCPQCSKDIWQERVASEDRDALIVHDCGYLAKYTEHERAALDAGDDRWLTEDQLVGAIHSAGELVTRAQLQRWILSEGLARETRVRPKLVAGRIVSVEESVYRLGDVRERARAAELERDSVTSAQVAQLRGVSEATVRKWVERGELTPIRAGARPLRFTREALGNVPGKRFNQPPK